MAFVLRAVRPGREWRPEIQAAVADELRTWPLAVDGGLPQHHKDSRKAFLYTKEHISSLAGRLEFVNQRADGQGPSRTPCRAIRESARLYNATVQTVPYRTKCLGKAAKLLGMDLTALSLDTVQMFARDAAAAGFKL